jgi:23S rRNA (uracil1939-C5)-methyltransferase
VPRPTTQTIEIVDLDDEGRGVGRDADTAVHVAGALPGDLACVSIEHRSPHEPVAWARLVSLERPSAKRVPGVCPATGRCGGCALGAYDYDAQLAWKEARLGSALTGLGATPLPIVRSSPHTRYRNSAKLVYGRPRPDAAPCLGGYAARSHRLVDLAGCRVLEAPLDEVRAAVLAVLLASDVAPYDEQTRAGLLSYVALRDNARGEVLVTLVGVDLAAVKPLGAAVAAAHPGIVGVCANLRPSGNAIFGADTRVLEGRGELEEDIGPARLFLSPTAFFQVNRGVATRLYGDLADAVLARTPRNVVDVYAGVGGIALTLAARGCAHIVGIEVHEQAVRDAARAASSMKLPVRFVAADAAVGLAAEARPIDAVVVNPPRRGLDEAMRASLAEARPRVLAYVSCDPSSLARDLAALVTQGMRIESVRAYDMHPHTPHIEALAILTRA